jgi:hypothetical protein
MTPLYSVQTTPRYERLSNKLLKGHRDFGATERSAVVILAEDPYNQSRRSNIKKLEAVPAGEGQFRLAIGR